MTKKKNQPESSSKKSLSNQKIAGNGNFVSRGGSFSITRKHIALGESIIGKQVNATSSKLPEPTDPPPPPIVAKPKK